MKPGEVRYRVTAALLQADEPLSLGELVDQCGVAQDGLLPVVRELVNEGLVVEGQLLATKPTPQYRWRTRWEREVERRVVSSMHQLQAAVGSLEALQGHKLDVESPPAQAFHDFVIAEYRPPKDKQYLVFLQCSVRRPFSSSPSHAAMRRAISTATGHDPSKNFETCPVHVVVLASKIGPVPYELEDIYPANVRGGGVKHFGREHYERIKPILAQRMAQYILTHRTNYSRMTTFTEGRYAEVMEEARQIVVDRCGASADFTILPKAGGPTIVRVGQSIPRNYWSRYWIQLHLEIVNWLEPSKQAQARERLRAQDIHVRLRTSAHT